MEALKQARVIAEQVLELTKSLVFSGEKEMEEAEIEAYIAMLDEREPLIDELMDLKNEISEDVSSSPEVAGINKIIVEIAEINKNHAVIMKQLRKNAQASYKDIKQGQRIHAGYNPLPGNEVSNRIDVKH